LAGALNVFLLLELNSIRTFRRASLWLPASKYFDLVARASQSNRGTTLA
jgi:hypothetical protein